MSGLYLALITLMLAGAITVVLATINFPNGGHGFTGYNGSCVHIPPIRRPGIATTDPAFFRYSVIVAVADVPARARRTSARGPGERGRRSARASPPRWRPASTPRSTSCGRSRWRRSSPASPAACWPAAVRYLYSLDFHDPGLDHAAGRRADGRRLQHLGRDRRRVAAQAAAGAAQRLGRLAGLADDPVRDRRAPGADDRAGAGSSTRCPGTSRGSAGCCAGCVARAAAGREAGAVIEVSGPDRPLRRRHAARRHERHVRAGHVRADRSQRRRQDDVLQRPQRLRAARPPGSVRAFGEDLLAMAHFRRARWGLRRTFQTEQAIEELSVFDNVAMVHEHSKLSRRLAPRGRARARSSSSDSTCDPDAKVGTLGAGDRRLVEVARAVVGKPRLVLLDEPAAGLPDAGDRAPGRGDPPDPRAHRRAGDPRRPRHEPRLGVLRGDRRARLRQADRLRARPPRCCATSA